MTFTDEDLKRLKEKVFATPKEDWIHPHERPEYYKALIDRLEAAEMIATHVASRWKDSPFYVLGTEELIEAWRKAAGK